MGISISDRDHVFLYDNTSDTPLEGVPWFESTIYAEEFLDWCAASGQTDLRGLRPHTIKALRLEWEKEREEHAKQEVGATGAAHD